MLDTVEIFQNLYLLLRLNNFIYKKNIMLTLYNDIFLEIFNNLKINYFKYI